VIKQSTRIYPESATVNTIDFSQARCSLDTAHDYLLYFGLELPMAKKLIITITGYHYLHQAAKVLRK
jgi:hypothetical protein